MPIDNQIEPPQSFMAMYLKPGQTRPNAPQDVVLAKCHKGLLNDASDFNENEARWVIQRLAKLLGWEQPNFDAD